MPGTRHAKNNTALGYFTRHERAKLGWGSQRKRLPKDSMKQFYACTLCLKLCEVPVLCPGGDLFCRECILQSLLSQKRKNKQQMAEYNQQQVDSQQKLQNENRKNVVDKFLLFDRLQNRVCKPIGHEQSHLSSLNKTTFRNTPNSNILDASSSSNPSSVCGIESAKPNEKKLNCFWIPSLTPDAGRKVLKAPDMKTYCPGCNEPLKRKDLISCNFTMTTQDADNRVLDMIQQEKYGDDKEGKKKKKKESTKGKHLNTVNAVKCTSDGAAGLFECGSCSKVLTNATKCGCLKKCGHILCLQCIKQFVSKSKCCTVCDEPCKKKHIVMLVCGGTGFSAHGNQMEATKKAVAFQ